MEKNTLKCVKCSNPANFAILKNGEVIYLCEKHYFEKENNKKEETMKNRNPNKEEAMKTKKDKKEQAVKESNSTKKGNNPTKTNQPETKSTQTVNKETKSTRTVSRIDEDFYREGCRERVFVRV
jgi:ABC-type multidrug transport system ATPase subunit